MTQTMNDTRYYINDFFLGGQLVTSEMTTEKLVENATQWLSVKQMVKPFDCNFLILECIFSF
jgi:hypothetical protein